METWLQILSLVLITGVTGIVTFVLNRASRVAASEVAGGKRKLEHSAVFKILTWMAFLFFAAMLAGIVTADLSPGYVSIGVGFVLLAACPVLESFAWVTIDGEGLHDFKLWRGQRWMLWADVQSVRFSTVNSWFAIRDVSGRTIRISKHMRGIDELRRHVVRHCDAAVYDPEFALDLANPD